jgi:GAF domain-containing protein
MRPRRGSSRTFQLDGAVDLPAVSELLEALCDTARVSFGAESVSIAQVVEVGGNLVYVSASGRGAEAVVGMLLPFGRGLAGYAVAAGEALAVDDVVQDPRFARDVAERIGYVPNSVLVAPIRNGDDVIGVLSVLDRSQPAGAAALDLAGRFARAAAGAFELAAIAGAAEVDAPEADVELDAAALLVEEFHAFTASRRDRE